MTTFTATSPLLPEILALHGKWRANEEAVVTASSRLTWKEFIEGNHQFANALQADGIGVGCRIGVVMSNGVDMLQCLIGAMAAGVATVPINLSVNDESLIKMLDDAEVDALVVTADNQARIERCADKLPKSIRRFLIDELPESSEYQLEWRPLSAFSKGMSAAAPTAPIPDDTILNIIYSSGTTGLPKGIVHTQKGRRDWAYDLALALRYHSSSRTLLTIGLYSNISWVAMLTTLLVGGTVVISSGFDAADFANLVEAEQITHTAMVPIQFQRIIEELEARRKPANLASMQAMMSCGSPLHSELKKKIFSHFPCGIIELYGLTEGVITTIDAEQSEGRWASVGKPLLGTDLLILDSNEQPAGPEETGEVLSRGRITMPGYLNRPEANAEASYVDSDGNQWLRTGDIGYFDADGFLYIVDRKKDMILSGGQNIYPQDIESVIKKHPDVNDVAVIPAKSRKWGETPVALIVLEDGAAENTLQIVEWSNKLLGKQQRLADAILIDELPRNPNGKILKRELRSQYSSLEYD